MPKRVQIVRHAQPTANTFIGRDGEITVDQTDKTVNVHDGVTAGGSSLAKSDMTNAADATGIAAGRMSAADKSKLDGIETNATADQIASEVPVTPIGALVATNAQAAFQELDADLTTEAGLRAAHEANGANPHAVTKTQVGLANVTNDAQLKIASNLADLNSAPIARGNLGLGSVAVLNNGIAGGEVPTNAEVHTIERQWTKPQRPAIVSVSAGPTITCDMSLGNDFEIANQNQNFTLQFTNIRKGQRGIIIIENDALGNWTATPGSAVRTPNGQGLSPVGGANAYNIYSYYAYTISLVLVTVAQDIR